VYGSTLTFLGTEFTSSGLQNGDTIGSATLSSLGAAATAQVTGSPYVIQVSNAAGGTFAPANYTIAYVNGALMVTPAPLTVTADNQARIYGNGNPVFTTQVTGGSLFNGDTLSGAAASAATAASDVGTYAITQGTVAASGNYTLTFNDGTLAIGQRSITLTTDAGQSKIYGNADPVLTYFTSGLGAGAPLSGLLGRAGGENTGNYAINQGSITNAANPNYLITSFTANTLAITPRPLVIDADDKSKLQGAVNPLLTATGTGFAFGEGFGDLGGALSITTTAVTASPDGSYSITPSGQTSANYAITYANGVLTIGTTEIAQPVGDNTGAAATAAIALATAIEDGGCDGGGGAGAGGEGLPVRSNRCIAAAGAPSSLRILDGGMRLPAGLVADIDPPARLASIAAR
jgi:hypothetical protein